MTIKLFKKTPLVIGLLFCSLFSFGQQNRFAFKYITNNNGLSHNTVYDICQDSKGFVWIATEVGLNRYDGESIKQYYNIPEDKHSIPSSRVQSLVYTANDELFIGTNSGIALYHPETDNFERLPFNMEKYSERTINLEKGLGNELIVTIENEGIFFIDYKNFSISKFNSINYIEQCIKGNDSTYWAFTQKMLYHFDKNKTLLKEYSLPTTLFNSAISYIGIDSQERLWVGTFNDGLFILNQKTEHFNHIQLDRDTKMYFVRTIEEGMNPDEFWIGTESGLYIINIANKSHEHYTQAFNNKKETINDNAIYKIFRDKQGIFYAGTYFGGVNIVNTSQIGFNAIIPDNTPGNIHGKAVGTMAKSPDGNLWIATEDAGIAILDKKKNKFEQLSFNPHEPTSIASNNIHALLMDGNTCWAGHFMSGISEINTISHKAKHYIRDPKDPNSLINNFVFSLHFLSPDSILVGTTVGVDLFNKRTRTFSRFRQNEFAGCFIYDIFTAPDGKIWFCTYNKGIYILDPEKIGLMTHFQKSDHSGLTNNSIISHLIDSNGDIWIGTRYGGLLKYNADKQHFEQCNPNLLNDNIIYGIVEDNDGFFWVSTNKGISRLDVKNNTATHFNVKHGLSGNQHNYKSYFRDGDIIYFGSVSGLTWFNPHTIFTPQETPSVYFTNLRIFNEIMRPDSNAVIQQQIDFTKHLILKHHQNSFTLDYASINYFTNDIIYQYYLEGFDVSWSPFTDRTQVNYTNIAPGDYTFHIRAKNMINNSTSKERILNISIKPPFWISWYAYLTYVILLSGVAYFIYRTHKNRQQQKVALTIEKIEKENLKLLHQHKMNFFTYISHEFKTPLSIIMASVEMLTQKIDAENNEMLQTIKRSTGRLLFLVSQLMEFRKIETDHAVMHTTKDNVINFSNQIINTYRPLLEKKNIELNIKISYTKTEIFFDFDKLEKIMTNLLTNAIKYTPQNGTIDFKLNVDNKTIKFSVKDSGEGISEKNKDKIFEVFYNDSFSNDIVESSGIGLALTASLVRLLNGTITVESEQGKGSQFNVTLPYDMNKKIIPAASPKDVDTTSLSMPPSDIEDDIEIAKDEAPDEKKEYTIVIAEDNKDLSALLHKNFIKKYHIKCFENGEKAWQHINKEIPDILITDIMMPIMSGIELCQKVKTNVNLCHIPIVMLTAKDTKEAKIEGLQVGADAYVTKPFSMIELEIRLSNILNTQKVLKKRLKEIARFEGFDIPVSNHEQAFVEKILAIIQNNMEKSEFDVQFIADELNISRSNLHNKMKKLMNISTSEFINTVRINKAKELMVQEEKTLSEIAYEVGYNDPAYFTRIFKKQTGETPKEYRQQKQKQHIDNVS